MYLHDERSPLASEWNTTIQKDFHLSQGHRHFVKDEIVVDSRWVFMSASTDHRSENHLQMSYITCETWSNYSKPSSFRIATPVKPVSAVPMELVP